MEFDEIDFVRNAHTDSNGRNLIISKRSILTSEQKEKVRRKTIEDKYW